MVNIIQKLPKFEIELEDNDFAFYLAIKELTDAIKKLSDAVKSNART